MRLRRFLTFLLMTLLLPGVSHGSRAVDTLPPSITDEAFWKMITEFSEAGGEFNFEMYMSNEATFQTVLPELLNRVSPGGVCLGAAPEQNFTYITALRPKMAFIIDLRRDNMLEMLMYKALFEMSPTRTDFLSRLFSRRVSGLLSMPESQLSVDRLFAGLNSRGDTMLYQENLQRLKHHLQKAHSFALPATDMQKIEYIYNAFFRGGPAASLTSYGTSYQLLMLQTDDRGRNRNFLASDATYQFVRQMQQR